MHTKIAVTIALLAISLSFTTSCFSTSGGSNVSEKQPITSQLTADDKPLESEEQPENKSIEEVEVAPAKEVAESPVEVIEQPQVVIEQPVKATTNEYQNSYSNKNGSNFEYDGVWKDEHWTYKWYSSRNPNSHHWRTNEWMPGTDGVYRDSQGYAVVASSDLPQGSVIDSTPFGPAKVYDTGCPSGVIDVYVNY